MILAPLDLVGHRSGDGDSFSAQGWRKLRRLVVPMPVCLAIQWLNGSQASPVALHGRRVAAGARMSAANTARVLVVDDQTVVREGLTLILSLLPGIDVVGAAAGGEEAVRLAVEAGPDVVLMDLRMPHMDGVEATRHILAEIPRTKILVLTTYCDGESVAAALRVGAHGYLTKNAHAAEIAEAIANVLRGDTHFDPIVQQRLVAMAISDRDQRPPANRLTPREVDVLRLIAHGKSNNEIAQQLFITEATVKTHINNLFAKIGVRDRAQAVTYAFQHGVAVVPSLPVP